MPSLFRIDRNSMMADAAKPTTVALPGFQEIVKLKQSVAQANLDAADLAAQAAAQERAAAHAEAIAKEEMAIAEKRRELEDLKKQIELLNQQAAGIVENAKIEAEKIRAEAEEQGYQVGYTQASERARTELEAEHKHIEDAVMALKGAADTVYDQVEESVLDLAMFVAERVLQTELDRNDEAFLGIVRDTLSKVKYQNNIIIRVSKAEYERLFADPSSDIVKELKNSGIEVKQDLSLREGDCIAETAFGTINAGVRTQLKRLGYALTEGEGSPA